MLRQCTQNLGPVSSEFPIVSDNHHHTFSELNMMAFTLYNKTATSSTEKLSLIMFAQLWGKQSLGLRGPSESCCNTNAQLWKLVQAIPFRKGAPNGLIIAWYLISDVNIWSRFQSLAKRLLKIPEKKKKNRQAGFICTSKLSYDRKCSKYHNCMYFSVGRMLAGTQPGSTINLSSNPLTPLWHLRPILAKSDPLLRF